MVIIMATKGRKGGHRRAVELTGPGASVQPRLHVRHLVLMDP